LYHNNPYKITNFHYLDLKDFEKSVIHSKKIKSVSCLSYKLNKELKPTGQGRPVNYSVTFNTSGNPLRFKKSECAKNCEISEYSFDYDSTGTLIHIKELLIYPNSVMYFDVDVFFFYDNENKVIKELVSEKSIYPQGYKYGGTSYLNDTSTFMFDIRYDANKRVSSVITYRSDYKSWTLAKEMDTLYYSSNFDSIFIKKPRTNGIKLDSLGNVCELVSFRHIHSTPTNDTLFFYKYQYDAQNRLKETQMFNAKNQLNSTWYFDYNLDGLISSEKYVGRKYRWMKVYQYEKY